MARVIIPPEVFAKIVGELLQIHDNRNNIVNVCEQIWLNTTDKGRLNVALSELSLHIKHLRDLLAAIAEENYVGNEEVPNGC